MTSENSPAAILQEHLAICEELHALLLEENRVMRTQGVAPSEELLARKKTFLPRLDASLERLKSINEGSGRLAPGERDSVKEARSRLMQILMLDRENERLLLKASLPPTLKAAYAPAAPGQVARAYQRYGPSSSPPPPGGTGMA